MTLHLRPSMNLERTSTIWSIIIRPHLSKIQIQSPQANSDDPAWARTNARPDLDPYCLRMSEVACHCVVASNCCPLNFLNKFTTLLSNVTPLFKDFRYFNNNVT